MMAYIINATSSRAYERILEEHVVIIFPSSKTLRKITINLDHKNALDDKRYLKM